MKSAANSKILFMLKNFRQGWGGGPESIRLMARQLAKFGVTSDVVDGMRLHSGVEKLEVLPLPADSSRAGPFALETAQTYDAILQVGPWQNPLEVSKIIRRRSREKPYLYLPRGGLARIEFEGPRGPKKFPYYLAVESRFINASDGIIFSSEAERAAMTPMYRRHMVEVVIPDYFEPPPTKRGIRRESGELRIGFLAEISPRKGLLPFMQALARWTEIQSAGLRVRVMIGGSIRAGAERYFARVQSIAASIPGVEVIYCGSVSHADRPSFYASTDLFVLPSLFESFGLTALEAISAGCVLLCSPYVGALQYFPQSASVVVLDNLEEEGIVRGLDLARLAVEDAQSPSSATHTAIQAISSINASADERWTQLLQPTGRPG